MGGTTRSLILLVISSVVFAQSTATNGTFFCTCLWPHNYKCDVINYNSSSKWLIFNDTQSTLLHLYKMTIRNVGDTKNLVETIFKNYKYVNDFSISFAEPPLEIRENTFENAKELKILKLSCNQIKALHENMFKNMKKIESFDASANLIETLYSKTFQGLEHLKNINFEENKITHIELGTFYNLNLSSLSLRLNKLKTFDFRNLNISSKIDLTFNYIGDITANDIDITVSFEVNNLTELSSNFMKHFKKFETFNACSNNIEYLHSDTFKGLHNLKEINLNHNQIYFIEKGTFYNLNIDTLYLGYNRLIEFDFFNLTAKSVFINTNLLTALTINGNVEYVYASYNNISRIDIVTRTLKDLNKWGNSEDLTIKYV